MKNLIVSPETYQNQLWRAVDARREWLEEIAAGLLSNGIPMNDISVQMFIDGRMTTKVLIKGVEKYKFQMLTNGRIVAT